MWDFQEPSAGNLVEGVNHNFKIVAFCEATDGQYGPQYYFEFEKSGLSVRHWVGVPSMPEVLDDDSKKSFQRAVNNFKSTLGQFFTGFYPEGDQTVRKHFEGKNINSPEEYVKTLFETLPKDWMARSASLILYYKQNQDGTYGKYLSIPKNASLNSGRIFSACAERPLKESDWFVTNIKGQKNKQSQIETAIAVPVDENFSWSTGD